VADPADADSGAPTLATFPNIAELPLHRREAFLDTLTTVVQAHRPLVEDCSVSVMYLAQRTCRWPATT